MRNFTVSPSKKTKILMVFSSVILLLLISAFFYLIFVEGFPFEEELYIQIFFFVMMTVFIFCLIGAIDNMTRTISVDSKNIHSKSFLSSKTFTFDDISIMPSDVKSTTRNFHSKDKKILFYLQTEDIGFDLFMERLAAFDTSVVLEKPIEEEQETKSKKKRLLRIQLLASAIVFVLFIALVALVEYLPVIFHADSGADYPCGL
ncbi:MAG: hypothetical protein FWG89_00530 [Treponema sp.]|nr:hypothetical protein [Treponema sp.]